MPPSHYGIMVRFNRPLLIGETQSAESFRLVNRIRDTDPVPAKLQKPLSITF